MENKAEDSQWEMECGTTLLACQSKDLIFSTPRSDS